MVIHRPTPTPVKRAEILAERDLTARELQDEIREDLEWFELAREAKREVAALKSAKMEMVLRAIQAENLRRVFRRQQTGCTFSVLVDNTTVYEVNLDTLPDNTSIPFQTSDFTPSNNSALTYIEQCPPGTVNFPQLDLANLTLVTGPAPAPPVSLSSVSFILLVSLA